MTNKPAFLPFKVTEESIEFINTNYVLRVTYNKRHDTDGSHCLALKLVNGTVLAYVTDRPETDPILRQWLDFLGQGK